MKTFFGFFIFLTLVGSINAYAGNCVVAGKYKSGNAYFILTKEQDSNYSYMLELYDEELNCKASIPSKAYPDMGSFMVLPANEDVKAKYHISFRNDCTEAQVGFPPSNMPAGCENFFEDPKDGRPWIFKKVSK